MTDKERYIIFCDQNRGIPLFYQPFWLDAVTGNNWDVLCSLDTNGDIEAFMPVLISKKRGLTAITNPVLTPHQGIYITEDINGWKEQKRQSYIFRISRNIISKIPANTFFKVRFHPEYTMWLPFYFAGFKQTTYYTYVLDNIQDHDSVFAGFKANTRNIIRKAEEDLTIVEKEDIGLLFSLLEKTFTRKNERMPFDLPFLERLNEACKKQRKILFVQDGEGQILAGMFLVFDQNRAYNMLFGTDFDRVQQGGPPFLIWESIKIASERVNVFDFEGSRLPTIQSFYQGFGGKPVPYFEISKAKNRFWTLLFTLIGKL
jgi:hypothetical protein